MTKTDTKIVVAVCVKNRQLPLWTLALALPVNAMAQL